MGKRQQSYCFEMPWHVEAPNLADPHVGIDRIVLTGNPSGRTVTLTVLDTADERLLRAGVVLAHRETNERGDWYLRAPAWRPWLPGEHAEPLGSHAELPAELVEMIQPLRRRAPIGPVASATRRRGRYLLLDETGAELGVLLDDRITVRRGGIATGRFREVTFEPVTMSPSQCDHVAARLGLVGAVRVSGFLTLFERAGAVVPQPSELLPVDPGQPLSFERFVSGLLNEHMHHLIVDDLSLRAGQVGDSTALQGDVAGLRGDLVGLRPLLDDESLCALMESCDAVIAHDAVATPAGLGVSYLDLLDQLAEAARTPRTGEYGVRDAKSVLREEVAAQAASLRALVSELAPESASSMWCQTQLVGVRLAQVWALASPVIGKSRKPLKHLRAALTPLAAAQLPISELGAEQIAMLTPQQAWEAGRAYQQGLIEVLGARREFLASWPKLTEELPGVEN